MGMANDLIHYQFSQDSIQRSDLTQFLGLFSSENLPVGERLEAWMGRFVITAEGWDKGQGVPPPEIRKFLALFYRSWPYSLFFCSLRSEDLRIIAGCCRPNPSVRFNEEELIQFLGADLVWLYMMCTRAGLSANAYNARKQAILRYFGCGLD